MIVIQGIFSLLKIAWNKIDKSLNVLGKNFFLLYSNNVHVSLDSKMLICRHVGDHAYTFE